LPPYPLQRRRLCGTVPSLTGTGYAVDGPLAGQNQVGSEDIINGEVKNADLGTDSVASGKIQDRQVKNSDLSIGASSSNTIADGGIQGVDVKNDTLTGAAGVIFDGGTSATTDDYVSLDGITFRAGRAPPVL